MPPENSCGNALTRVLALRDADQVEQLDGACLAPPSSTGPVDLSASTSWSPTVKTGVSADSGSWKTIAISLPRIRGHLRVVDPSSSCAVQRIEPVTVAFAGSRPITASEVTDLPDPDSPTMPSVRPGCRSKSTPRTASTRPSSDGN